MNKKQDEIIVINDVKDNTRGNLVQGVCVKEDLVDHFSVGGVSQFPGKEIVNENENDHSADKGGTLGVAGKNTHGKDVIFPSGQK